MSNNMSQRRGLEEVQRILREDGVVGAGGAGFPTYAKLSRKGEVLLLNCAECEPLLELHQQLLERHPREIFTALEDIALAMEAGEVVICIKKEYEAAIQAARQYIASFPGFRLHLLPGVYPAGDEVVMIYEATGRVVQPGGLPIQEGIVVLNVETAYNAYQSLYCHKPTIRKLVTITGEVDHPVTCWLPLGISAKEAVALAGKITVDEPVFWEGGPMMGKVVNGYAPVTKTTNSIIVLPRNHPLVLRQKCRPSIALKRAASACCQCRSCTDWCPRHALGHPIQPHLFMRAAAGRDYQDSGLYLQTLYCSGCGLCENFACPQGLSPRSLMVEYKAGLKKAGINTSDAILKPVKLGREYQQVHTRRLLSRLGLAGYKQRAPYEVLNIDPSEVTVPMAQHIGAPSEPCVTVGDRVEAGQVIGKAAHGLSVDVHSSIDGTVVSADSQMVVIRRACVQAGEQE